MRARTAQTTGFTLIELMVVMVIIAVAVVGVGLSLGATERVKLRSSCYLVASAVRYAYSHSVSSGATTRVVFDFSARTVQIQETEGRVVLNREDESGSGLDREDVFDDDAGVPGGSLLDQQMNSIGQGLGGTSMPSSSTGMGGLLGGMSAMGSGGLGMEGMSAGVEGGHLSDPFLASMAQGQGFSNGNPYGYRKARFSPLAGKRGEKRELEGKIQFAVVHVPHAPKPVDEGKAYIYFFPGGMTEHAIIQLTDGEDRTFSVEIHPLSGRPTIHSFALDPEEELDALQEAEE